MIAGSDLILQIGGIKGMEWIIILVVVVVLLFGAKKLPDLARSIGRARGEFERGKIDIDKELAQEKSAVAEPVDELQKLIKAARELGIDTVGKTKEQLKEEISKSMMR